MTTGEAIEEEFYSTETIERSFKNRLSLEIPRAVHPSLIIPIVPMNTHRAESFIPNGLIYRLHIRLGNHPFIKVSQLVAVALFIFRISGRDKKLLDQYLARAEE